MALLKIALLLFICALTSASDADGVQNVLDDVQVNGDVCKDCTQIFTLVADLISNPDLQKKITNAFDRLCSHLPGASAKICQEEVDKMLPVAVTFLTTIVKPSEVCKVLGLCSSCGNQEKLLQYFIKEAIQNSVTAENPSSQCSICIFIFKTLDSMIPKERTEQVVIHLLDEICRIVPPTHRSECETIVSKVTKVVIDAILSFATPQAICSLMHLCKGQEAPLDVSDPCTLPSYRCKDMKTALNCGTMFYCQKFVWKALKYDAL